MSGTWVEILVVFLLIVINGIFAMSELAVVSARKARLHHMANSGSASARVALELAESPNRFLSTVQIGISLVAVLTGAFSGAAFASTLSQQIERISWLAPYSHALGLAIVVLTITYFSLVIGELVPKRLALQNPEKVASFVARPMRWLSILAFPVERILSLSTSAVVMVLGVRRAKEPPVTEEEIRLMIEEGTEAGVFRATEQDMVESVFQLDDRHISALMTPHTEIVWLDVNDPPDVTRGKLSESRHSAFVVCRDSLDNLIGVVRAQDLLALTLEDQPLDLEAASHKPQFIPENATASKAVELFKRIRDHVVLVIDEHGSIQGLITEHDLLEAIVGHIPSPGDVGDQEAVRREDGSWLFDGLMAIDEVQAILGIKGMADDERGSYQTLGGFMMSQIGQIPHTGQCFRWQGFRFEVVDMDGYRVDKVLVAPEPGAETGPCAGSGDNAPEENTPDHSPEEYTI